MNYSKMKLYVGSAIMYFIMHAGDFYEGKTVEITLNKSRKPSVTSITSMTCDRNTESQKDHKWIK